jgi:oxygen-independent coproporphyrinogen III oxidase
LISLYFHFPFCTKKCPYCHFFVIKDHHSLKKRYLEVLKKEWEQKEPLISDKKVVSIYLGGGTPSLMDPHDLEFFFSFFPFPLDDIEVTLEANPENMAHAHMWKRLGINRVSIGVQSFNDHELQKLGRSHSAEKAYDAVIIAKNAGIDNITLDLMYDLPCQTLASFTESIKKAVTLPITHLSLYNLVIEPNTPFFKRKKELQPLIAQDQESVSMLEIAIKLLEKEGLSRYEISAFAKNGFISKHNTGYWTGRPFLGLGPSAFSYWEKSRFSNICNLAEYEKRVANQKTPADFSEKLSPAAHFRELLAIRLRYFEPFKLEEIDPTIAEEIVPLLNKLENEGYLFLTDQKLSLTPKGKLFYDSLAVELI